MRDLCATTGGSALELEYYWSNHCVLLTIGVKRFRKIVNFLENADRFHGVWPHWINGKTGRIVPFGRKDDGGDLVESSFLMTSLLCARQYFKDGNAEEKQVAASIDKLWKEMEFDWYRRGGQDVLYWHWSPNYGWK